MPSKRRDQEMSRKEPSTGKDISARDRETVYSVC